MEDIELVVVLTNPQHHYNVVSSCLQAGKHTYVEKPLALSANEGNHLITLANEKNLLLSGAPDTILGASIQTARRLIKDGWLGTPARYTHCFNHPHPNRRARIMASKPSFPLS